MGARVSHGVLVLVWISDSGLVKLPRTRVLLEKDLDQDQAAASRGAVTGEMRSDDCG